MNRPPSSDLTSYALLVLHALEKRFGVLPDWAERQFHHADRLTLERWHAKSLTAVTLEQVFEELA